MIAYMSEIWICGRTTNNSLRSKNRKLTGITKMHQTDSSLEEHEEVVYRWKAEFNTSYLNNY